MLDAAVLVPPGMRDVLLSLADGGAFRPVWQSEIEAEVRRNAIRRELAAARKVGRTLWLPLVPRMLNQPKDRHVLAAAVGAKATHLVTPNLRDFPKHSLPAGLVAARPGAFATELLRTDPDSVMRGLERMAARHQRPPTTLRELAELLAAGQQMPGFGRALAELL